MDRRVEPAYKGCQSNELPSSFLIYIYLSTGVMARLPQLRPQPDLKFLHAVPIIAVTNCQQAIVEFRTDVPASTFGQGIVEFSDMSPLVGSGKLYGSKGHAGREGIIRATEGRRNAQQNGLLE